MYKYYKKYDTLSKNNLANDKPLYECGYLDIDLYKLRVKQNLDVQNYDGTPGYACNTQTIYPVNTPNVYYGYESSCKRL